MAPTFNFEEGLSGTIRFIENSSRPVLVAVYGTLCQRKTEFIEKTASALEEKYLTVYKGSSMPHISLFENLKHRPNSLKDVLLFNCAWERHPGILTDQDPNSLCMKVLGRNLDLNIGYNTSMFKDIKRNYDFKILDPVKNLVRSLY